MNKKRTVVLFGAGAVISWGGPKTSELTKLIIKDSAPQFICNDGKTKVTEFIYHILLKNGYKEEEINFETIISVIEELIIHYAYFDNKKELPSLHKSFFYSNFEEIISNFSIHGGQKNIFINWISQKVKNITLQSLHTITNRLNSSIISIY